MTASTVGSVSGCISWKCGTHVLEVGSSPLIMGILNVTPDSFSDAMRYFDPGKAVARGVEMAEEGADIVDVGGESTRPGARIVSPEEEKNRVIPVIEQLSGLFRDQKRRTLISIDTSKAEVAAAAIRAGAVIINDVTALTGDPMMPGIALASGAGVVLMHMRGNPRVMQDNPQYGDVTGEVLGYLQSRLDDLTGRGLELERLVVDPGIGFGKTIDHNLELLRHLEMLRACGRPVMVGLSRKSFLGKLTGGNVDQRLIPGIAALSFCIMHGADILRVHDVKDSVDAVKVVMALAGKTGE